MKYSSVQQMIGFRTIVVMAAFALVLSLGIHAVQVDHIHPGAHSAADSHHEDQADPSSFSEYLHGSEKKLFLLLVLGFLALGIGLFLTNAIPEYSRLFSCNTVRPPRDRSPEPRLFDIYRTLFCSGILHPKVY